MEPPAGAGGRAQKDFDRADMKALLQWSHQPELVEGYARRQGPARVRRASMEPPAGAGGRSQCRWVVVKVTRRALQWSHQPELVEGALPRVVNGDVASPLQWSHQPELVEGSTPCSFRSAARSRFNGATSRSWWKARLAGRSRCNRTRCFNGATSRSWWKAVTLESCGSRRARFNGATSRSWWKVRERSVGQNPPIRLQWSHQPELVEGRPHWADSCAIQLASMEPPAGAGGRRNHPRVAHGR